MYLFSECKSTYFYGEAQNFYVKVSVKPIAKFIIEVQVVKSVNFSFV